MRLVYSRGRERGSAPTAYVTVNPIADRITAARRDGVAAVTLPRELPATGVEAMPWLLAGAKTPRGRTGALLCENPQVRMRSGGPTPS